MAIPTVRYRLNAFEVDSISQRGETFAGRNTTFWGVLTDPTFPDGMEILDRTDNPHGPPRILGLAKIAEPLVGPNGNVRNATQAEIDLWQPAQDADRNQQDADQADFLIAEDGDPVVRKQQTAVYDIEVREFNIIREWLFDFQAAVALASNLNDIKIAVAALAVLDPRDLDQLRTAIRNRISPND